MTRAAFEQSSESLRASFLKLIQDRKTTADNVMSFLTDWPIFLPFWCPHENMILTKLNFGISFVADFAHVRSDTPGARWHFFRVCSPQTQLIVDGHPSSELLSAVAEITEWHNWFTTSPKCVMGTMPFKAFMQKEFLATEPNINLIVGRTAKLEGDNPTDEFRFPGIRLKTYDQIADNIDQPWWHRDKPLMVCRADGQNIRPITEMKFQTTYSVRHHELENGK